MLPCRRPPPFPSTPVRPGLKSFVDNKGRTWPVQLNSAALRRVRRLLGIDILQLDWKGLGSLLGNMETVVNVLYCVCKPDADILGISDVDFGRALLIDPAWQGYLALMGAIAELCPNPYNRSALRAIIQEHKNMS